MIKMVNEFKLTLVHVTRPNPMVNPMQICGCTGIYRWTKKLWKIRTGPPGFRAAGCWAFGLPGRWAVAGREPLSRGPALFILIK